MDAKLKERLQDIPKRFRKNIILNYRYEMGGMFMEVTNGDKRDYQQWAREHFNSDAEINATWHPAVIEECIKMIRGENE